MCCGDRRQQSRATERARPETRVASGKESPAAPRRRPSVVYMEYTGQTGLTALGGRSGARYRFEHAGAIVAVDPSDRRSLLAVPQLRQVASPW
jgi:hypothetical protein